MARIRSLQRARKEVGSLNLPNVTTQINGWHLELDESVDWHVVVGNPDPTHPVRLGRAKPHMSAGISPIGIPWAIVDFYEAGPGGGVDRNIGHVDNEDQFFFAQRFDGATWQWLDGVPGQSHAELTNNASGCNMSWIHPSGGQITLTVFAH